MHVAEQCEDLSLDFLHGFLDLRLVARPANTRRQHGHSVVGGQILVGWIQVRLVEGRALHARLGVIRHEELRHAAEEGEGPNVRADPVADLLRPRRLSVGVA